MSSVNKNTNSETEKLKKEIITSLQLQYSTMGIERVQACTR